MPVVLRPIEAADAPGLRAAAATPEVARWWGTQGPDFPFDDETVTRLAVLVGDEVAGMVQYFEEPDPDGRHADIDIFLGPAHQGRGIGTETVTALVRHLVEVGGHHRVTLSTSVNNAVAIRCYEQAGFRRVGVLEKAGRDQRTGEWADELLFEYVVPARHPTLPAG